MIVIQSDFVTIDLNGFSILGTTNCSGGFPCPGEVAGAGGSGIRTSAAIPNRLNFFNITVRNGVIQGMGEYGLYLVGDSFLVEYLHVRSNGSSGISLSRVVQSQLSVIVQHNTSVQNDGNGIVLQGGAATDSVVTENRADGIWFADASAVGTAARNVIRQNRIFGLEISGPSVNYVGNVLSGNNGGGAQINGGINQGQNLCSGVACPGAVF